MSADTATAAPLTAARKRRSRWTVVVAVMLVVLVAGVVAFVLLRPKTSAVSSVSTGTVTRETLRVAVSGTGSTVVDDSVSVNPEISGTVEELSVSLGETVTAGQELYTISSSNVESQLLGAEASLLQSKQSQKQAKGQLQQAENQLYSAKTQQIQAEQNLDKLESQPTTTPGHANDVTIAKRQVKSAKQSVSSAQTSVDAAEIGVQVASANLTSAQQSYNDAVQDSKDTVVTSPIDGVVTALPISVGSAVNAGTSSSASSSGQSGGASTAGGTTTSASSSSGSGSAITISNLSNLKVQISVSEVDVTELTTGQKAEITIDALPDATFGGTVAAISPNGTSSSGVVSYDVDLTLGQQDPRLKPDMTATADIQTQVAENVLIVPNAAVKAEGQATYVEVVGSDGSTQRAAVTTGLSDDTSTEIKSGVAEGAVVVTGSTDTASSTSSGSGRNAGGGFIMGGPPGGGPPGGGN